jgi:very-short-patch-repair endonuclease
LITECNTRPDFIYEQEQVVIYVDGYYHLDAARQQRDIENTACLEDLGFTVLRFGILNDWERIFGNHSYLFGN